MYENKIFCFLCYTIVLQNVPLGLEKPESIIKQPRYCDVSCHRHEVQFSAEFTELVLMLRQQNRHL